MTMDQQTRVCKKCGVEYPLTKEFFYYSKNQWSKVLRGTCKECFKKKGRVKYRKEGRARKVELNQAVPSVVECEQYNQEQKRCDNKECRFHMGEFENCKYTCLWEVTSAYQNGLSYIEIAGIVNITDAGIGQIEARALEKLRKRMQHLEVYLEGEVDNRYFKPYNVFRHHG